MHEIPRAVRYYFGLFVISDAVERMNYCMRAAFTFGTKSSSNNSLYSSGDFTNVPKLERGFYTARSGL
ncbi:hypothetical protein BWP39_28990 [Paraburkholderia acidicola]|uniref:Uncharacterized protein n=1 Tax=Paraburkholderia acidicola TaxID=1912599 RepID=A0A2A4ESQ7_9BURK|nr:hypothetical protein BWP39_28990 [Paraburkholderia acidicola]